MTDYKAFIADHFQIVDKHAALVPFNLWPHQERLLAEMDKRTIILKPRQIGSSAFWCALAATDFILEDNLRMVILAHEAGTTTRLIDRVKFYLRSFEEKTGMAIPYKYNSRGEMIRSDNGNTLYIGTAGNRTFGVGDTIHWLLCSEVSRFEDAETVMTNVLQAVPREGRVIVESTANGYGNWYQLQWEKAQEPDSTFKPIFISYKDVPEYQEPGWEEAKRGEYVDERLFRQDFPRTPEEAFLSSGNPFFDLEALQRLKEAATVTPTTGELSMEGIWL